MLLFNIIFIILVMNKDEANAYSFLFFKTSLIR